MQENPCQQSHVYKHRDCDQPVILEPPSRGLDFGKHWLSIPFFSDVRKPEKLAFPLENNREIISQTSPVGQFRLSS